MNNPLRIREIDTCRGLESVAIPEPVPQALELQEQLGAVLHAARKGDVRNVSDSRPCSDPLVFTSSSKVHHFKFQITSIEFIVYNLICSLFPFTHDRSFVHIAFELGTRLFSRAQ